MGVRIRGSINHTVPFEWPRQTTTEIAAPSSHGCAVFPTWTLGIGVVLKHRTRRTLFGYTKLYGQVPGGQAELLRVPHADYGPVVVPEGAPDDRYLFLSDVLPTAWQAVQYASVPKDGALVVLGLGPIGDMSCRVARHLGVENIIAIDLVPERLQRAASAASRC
jgi:threonine dehydrogenase-like Zn-dependent dehydrogenase